MLHDLADSIQVTISYHQLSFNHNCNQSSTIYVSLFIEIGRLMDILVFTKLKTDML